MKNALFRLSKYSGDKNVFNDYTINALQQTASQMMDTSTMLVRWVAKMEFRHWYPMQTIPYTQLQGVPVFNTAML